MPFTIPNDAETGLIVAPPSVLLKFERQCLHWNASYVQWADDHGEMMLGDSTFFDAARAAHYDVALFDFAHPLNSVLPNIGIVDCREVIHSSFPEAFAILSPTFEGLRELWISESVEWNDAGGDLTLVEIEEAVHYELARLNWLLGGMLRIKCLTAFLQAYSLDNRGRPAS